MGAMQIVDVQAPAFRRHFYGQVFSGRNSFHAPSLAFSRNCSTPPTSFVAQYNQRPFANRHTRAKQGRQGANADGGDESVRLQLATNYLERLKALATEQTQVLLPADLTDFEALLKPFAISNATNGEQSPTP